MKDGAQQKQENRSRYTVLRIVRTPDETMKMEMARRIYALRIEEGKARPRRFYKLVANELFPAASLSKMTDDAIKAGCDGSKFHDAIVHPISQMIREKFAAARRRKTGQMDTGEFTPPTAPGAQVRVA